MFSIWDIRNNGLPPVEKMHGSRSVLPPAFSRLLAIETLECIPPIMSISWYVYYYWSKKRTELHLIFR